MRNLLENIGFLKEVPPEERNRILFSYSLATLGLATTTIAASHQLADPFVAGYIAEAGIIGSLALARETHDGSPQLRSVMRFIQETFQGVSRDNMLKNALPVIVAGYGVAAGMIGALSQDPSHPAVAGAIFLAGTAFAAGASMAVNKALEN